MFKKFVLLFVIQLFIVNHSISMEKETTFNKKLFDKAQSEGKVVIVSSWIKYCSSCASQMKVLNKAKMMENYLILNLIILNIFHLM